jgi:UDP:flavonoid glycosyltransferase YjiC (YdhE family)
MRILVTTHPGSGHLHPLVPLLRGLTGRGHDVLVATSRSFCPEVESLGFPAAPVGRDWLESEAASTLPGFVESPGLGQIGFFISLAGEAAPATESVAAEWGAELILRESSEFGGWIAAERLGLPHVECGINMATGGAIWAGLPVIGERFAALLENSALPPDPALDRLNKYLFLDFLPPSFTPDFLMPPATRRNFRPDIYDGAGSDELPSWWNDVRGSGQPIVYATIGTVFNLATDVFNRIIAAFANQSIQAVITVGKNVDPRAFDTPPDNVHIERYIPQSSILGECRVVLFHGGCNTLISALVSGLPMVCLPLSADQPFNAQRCVDLGIGKSLANYLPDGELVPLTLVEQLSPDQIWDAVDEVISDDRYYNAVKSLRSEMMAQPDTGVAVDAICNVSIGRI